MGERALAPSLVADEEDVLHQPPGVQEAPQAVLELVVADHLRRNGPASRSSSAGPAGAEERVDVTAGLREHGIEGPRGVDHADRVRVSACKLR